MVYIVKASEQDENLTTLTRIFLAGCVNTDWRKEFVKYFEDMNVIFYDPKRDDWDNINIEEQIKWEYDRLKYSDIIVYWFNEGSVCPITLLEYGMWGLSRGTPIAVGSTIDYEKRNDLTLQTKLARPDTRIVDNLYELSYETKRLLKLG